MKKTDSVCYSWLVVALLWIVALLNYMDRQMLSTMRSAIGADIAELQNAENFGILMAVFLWIYCFVSPFAGAVADRLSRKWLIIGSLAVWSGVTIAMGFSTTFHELMILRATMGISEALYIPAALSLISDYFTGSSRSLAIGVHMTGLYMGQALGGFGANAASAFSWQGTFMWFGIIGIAYGVLLAFVLRDKRVESKPKTADAAPVQKVNVLRSFAMIFSNIAFWVILFFFASTSLPGWATKNWLPELFQTSLGIPMEQAGPVATISIAVSSFIGVMIGGPLSDRWVKRNIRGRVYTSSIGLSMMIPALILMGVGDSMLSAIGAALFFGVGYGMFDANNMPILCQFIPSRQRATAYGIMNMVGVCAGAMATTLLGSLAAAGSLGLGFAVMAAGLVIALGLQLIVLKPTTDNME